MDNQANPVKSSQSESNRVNSNKNFLIAAIIIAVIAVGAGGFILGKYYNDISKETAEVYESGEDANKITEEETGKCAFIKNTSEKNQCWTDLAKEEKDENYCKKISADFPEVRGDCYTELAILKDDSLICEKIISSSLHKSCLEYFEDDDEKDEMADWKTYKNEEYGFSFKYSENWNVKEDNVRNIVFAGDEINFSIGINNYSDIGAWSGCIINGEEIAIEDIKLYPKIYTYLEKSKFSQNQKECSQSPLGNSHIIYTELCIDENNQFLNLENHCNEYDEYSDNNKDFYYQFLLDCEGNQWKGRENMNRCEQLFEQILSTFKFTE